MVTIKDQLRQLPYTEPTLFTTTMPREVRQRLMQYCREHNVKSSRVLALLVRKFLEEEAQQAREDDRDTA